MSWFKIGAIAAEASVLMHMHMYVRICEGPAEASMHIAITVISSNTYAFITAVVSCNLYRHNHAVVYHN